MSIRRGLSIGAGVFVVVFAWVASAPLNPLLTGVGFDREVFRYIGMVIAQGGMPYLDAFDHKAPLIYVMAALTHASGDRGFWVLETWLLAFSSLAVGVGAVRRRWPLPVLFPLYFIALMRLADFSSGGGLTRSFGACFIALALASTTLPSRFRYFLLGLFGTTVFFFQQNDAVPLLIPFLFLFAREPAPLRRRWPWLVSALAGALAVAVPVCFWLIHGGAWQAFLDDAFRFNTKYYASHFTVPQLMARAYRVLGLHYFQRWSLFAGGLLLLLLPVRKAELALLHWLGWIGALLLGLWLQLMMVSLSGAPFTHYYLSLVPWLVFVSGELLNGVRERFPGMPRRASVLLCLALLYQLPNDALGRVWSEGWRARKNAAEIDRIPGSLPPLFRPYFQEVERSRGQAYVFGNTPMLSALTEYGIIAPSRWCYVLFWSNTDPKVWDPELVEFRGILGDLDRNRTKYVLDYSRSFAFVSPRAKELWSRYLAEHYSAVASERDATMYRRNAQTR